MEFFDDMCDEGKAFIAVFGILAVFGIVLVVTYNWRVAVVERAHIEAGEELTTIPTGHETVWRKRGEAMPAK